MMDGEMERIWLATANSELRSEVLALKQENERHLATIVRYMSSVSEMVDLLAEKDAKIERLRAAGNDMAIYWEEMSWTGDPEYIAWQEACDV